MKPITGWFLAARGSTARDETMRLARGVEYLHSNQHTMYSKNSITVLCRVSEVCMSHGRVLSLFIGCLLLFISIYKYNVLSVGEW